MYMFGYLNLVSLFITFNYNKLKGNCPNVLAFLTIFYNIVTCQPIVGLRNRALLGSRPLNALRPNTPYATIGEAVFIPCRAMPSRTAPCVATQQAAMTSHGTTLISEATPL
jgi:hypothetical protein